MVAQDLWLAIKQGNLIWKDFKFFIIYKVQQVFLRIESFESDQYDVPLSASQHKMSYVKTLPLFYVFPKLPLTSSSPIIIRRIIRMRIVTGVFTAVISRNIL